MMGIGSHFFDLRGPGKVASPIGAGATWSHGSINYYLCFSLLKDLLMLLDLPEPLPPPWWCQPPFPVIGQAVKHPPKADGAHKMC